jgi:hypothetical protein
MVTVTSLGDFFANWATFGSSLLFISYVVDQRNGKILAYFLLKHFHSNKQFKNMI